MSFLRIGFRLALLGFLFLSFFPSTFARFQDFDAEEKQATLYAERFLSILEKNPQRGTALEKVFVHHLQRGTLDALIQSLEKRVQADPNDGTAWMLLGLFESQRRFDSQAIAAFAQAEKLRPDDALPAYYRGQCLLRTGEPTAAVAAFESAIERKPTRIVLLELFELIGRTHHRQSRNDFALDCWKRMEAAFPNDPRVLEQIANIQKQEGALQEAFAKFERLIALTKDAYQRTQFRIEATQLQIQLGEREKGLDGLTAILSELNPDGWLFRDVQRKIEEVFLAGNDQVGLIQFYEKRLHQAPDDIESMVRLSKFLTSSSRVAEANQWMTQAIERAPSRLELRRSLIEQLTSDQQISAAVEQYRQLSNLDPTNMDTLREWGKLVLRDTSRSLEEGKNEAARIWNKMLEIKPDEALLQMQVAELFLSAQMPEEAEKLFERAIQLAPDETQYREYLGDFLLHENRREEAFVAWNAIAQGERRNAQSVMRLAEIYLHAKEIEISVALARQACELAPKDPMVFIRAAKMQSKARRFDEALKSLAIAEPLADNEEQRESIIQDRMDALEKSSRLKVEADTLRSQLRAADPSDRTKLSQKQLLVRYLVRLKLWSEAQLAVDDALSLDGKSLSMLLAASEIAEGRGDASKSIETLRKLAELDRRRRQEYLQKVARHQVRQQKFVDAIETAKEVVQAIPSKVEGYEFMAQICFQANKRDMGIETLRKALRIAPGSMELIIALGNALVESKKDSEAIEIFWQALVKTTKLDDKLDLTMRLTKLHQSQSGATSVAKNLEGLSPFIERLELSKQDPAQRFDYALCLSHVYQSVSDYTNARRVLEELLSDRARDSNILKQLSKICVSAGDLEKAIDYQKQLVAMLPGQETESQLANLLRQNGEWSEANAIVMKLLQSERDPATVLQNIDSLLHKGECDLVLQTLQPLLRKQPENWELLYRKGLALAGTDEWIQSHATMEQILRLEVDREDYAFQNLNSVDKKGRVTVNTVTSIEQNAETSVLSAIKELETLERTELLDIALGRGGLVENTALSGMGGVRWSPKTYGEVRWTCIAWLVCAEAKEPQCKSSWITQTLERLEHSASRSDWIDAYAIAKYKQDFYGQVQAIANLIESGEADLNQTLLAIVHRRHISGIASDNRTQRPLTRKQLQLLKNAFESAQGVPTKAVVTQRNGSAMMRQWPSQTTFSIQTSRQFQAISNLGQYGSFQASRLPQMAIVLHSIVNELRFAGLTEEPEAFLTQLIESSQSEWQLVNLCEYFLMMERYQDIEKPLLHWFELQLRELKENGASSVAKAGILNTGMTSTAMVLESPTDFAYRLIENHGDAFAPEFLVRCVERAADISDQQLRHRAFSPLTPAVLAYNALMMNTPQIQNRGYVIRPTQAGSSIQAWAVNFVSPSLQNLLRAAGPQSHVAQFLQERMDQTEGLAKPLAKLYFVLSHSQELQPQEDGKRVTEALTEIGKEPEYALIAAAALMSRKNDTEARRVADNFSTTDAQDALTRELIILFSSAALKDNDRIKASLKELAVHRIDAQTSQYIFFALQQGSAKDIAINSGLFTTLLNRLAPIRPQPKAVSPSQAPSRSKPAVSEQEARQQEMVQFSNAGKNEEAVKIARQIISQPRVFPAPVVPVAGQNMPFQRLQRVSPAQAKAGRLLGYESIRKSAFDILKKHLELENLIAETQQRLDASPNSFTLLDQLAEMVEHEEANGPMPRTEKLLAEALRVRPHASALRLHYAKLLTGLGKHSEASDQFLELIRRDAGLGLTTVSESRNAFQMCGRTDDLLKAIREANFLSVRDRDTLLGVGNLIVKSGNGFEAGASVLEKLIEIDNRLLPIAIMNAYYPNDVLYPRLLKFTRDALIPNENDVAGNAWFGLDSIMDQRVSDSFFFRRILLCHRKEDVAGELKSSIQAAADRFPGWLAGQVMLAMIAERMNEPDESLRIRTALALNKRLFEECPETVAYELAKLFVDSPETRKTAIKLLEPLSGSRQFFGYDAKEKPSMMLAKAWLAEGHRGKAVDAIMMETSGILNPGPVEKMSPWQLASQMLTLGLPIDGYRLLDIPKRDAIPSNNAASEANEKKSAWAVRKSAVETLEKMTAQTAVAEILMDRTIPARQLPTMELMIRVPEVEEILRKSGSIESVTQNTLVRHAKAGQLSAIEVGLQKLATAHPTDLTVLSTQTIVRLELDSSSASESLKELEQRLSKFDPQIDELVVLADRNDTRLQVPETMQTVLTTWLVAKKCFALSKHLDAAERIGNRAFNVARVLDINVIRSRPTPAKNNPITDMGPEAELANLILFEWGLTEIQAGRTELGLLRWKKLKERVAATNDLRNDTMNTALKSSVERVWRQESFVWMLLLAHSAVNAQQLDFSKSIVRQLNQSPLPTTVPYVNGLQKGTEQQAKPSAQRLHQLLERWPNDKETASERFAALIPVVLPGDSDVYLFILNSNLLEEKPISLAASLVESARQSDRLMDLRTIVDRREPKDASNLSWLILRGQVAIALKDTEDAKRFLGQLKEHVQQLHGEKQLTNVTSACHAAIPAFQIDELREAAMPILNDYLAAMKRTGNYPDVDFSLLPLVRQVNEYLKNK